MWVRVGDEHFRDKRWDGVSYEARWHYLAVVAECSRSERYDCRIPLRLAHRASDAVEPMAATDELVASGWALVEGHDLVIVDGEERHMMPEHLRERRRKADQRRWTAKSRQAKCERGAHDEHCPPTCPEREGNEPGKALPQDRTGQDRTALGIGHVESDADRSQEPPEVSEVLTLLHGGEAAS